MNPPSEERSNSDGSPLFMALAPLVAGVLILAEIKDLPVDDRKMAWVLTAGASAVGLLLGWVVHLQTWREKTAKGGAFTGGMFAVSFTLFAVLRRAAPEVIPGLMGLLGSFLGVSCVLQKRDSRRLRAGGQDDQ